VEGFRRLPEKRQAEILGMLKAFTFVQKGENDDALDFINKMNKDVVTTQDYAGIAETGVIRDFSPKALSAPEGALAPQ
jgi:hypothetical protein